MEYPSANFGKQNNILFIRTLIIFLLGCGTIKLDFCFPSNPFSLKLSSLKSLPIEGNFSFESNEFASKDYGNQYRHLPLAVLHPKSISDISLTIKHIFQLGPSSRLTIAARGHGHSTQGQSLAKLGIVINMESIKGEAMLVNNDKGISGYYVDVYAGELWIEILKECLKFGLAPKSWTDYLHLTVGGTLSNAGISGQAFRHGPQISNVHQLEVITGKGEVVICSEEHNADLFHGVLGGLGQFGIITRARISLEPAPKMVKWIRVLYSDFSKFTKDQEYLITAKNTFDYIEGFVMINRTGVFNKWRSSFTPHDPIHASRFVSDGKTLYCLELTKHFDPENADVSSKETEELLSKLSYISSTLFTTETTYLEFLDRVHTSEKELRAKGMWDLPHPWMNLLIPGSKIQEFANGVFGNILPHTKNGPVLIYPLNKSRWDNRTSFVYPEDDIFYMVAFLYHAKEDEGLQQLLAINNKILEFCESNNLGVKQYLPHYTTQEQWRKHFGQKWQVFAQRKLAYDPLSILAPGQRIFQKGVSSL